MSLWTTLTIPGPGETKRSIHGFMADFDDWMDSVLNREDMILNWNIQASEETQLDLLKSEADRVTDKEKFRRIFKNCAYLAEQNSRYQSPATVLARIQLLPGS